MKDLIYNDILGTTPIYYDDTKISLSISDFKDRDLDHIYLSNCIKFGYDYSGRTPYIGVKQLPGNHSINIKTHEINEIIDLSEFVNKDNSNKNGKELKETLKETLDEIIVDSYLKDPDNTCVLLSGGLDSSIVYYTLKNYGFNPKAFTVENGESEYLPEGIEFLDVDDISLEEAISVVGLPIDLGSLLPQVAVAKALGKKGFKRCMTGDGADELFGGYRRIHLYDSQYSDIFCELPYYHIPRVVNAFKKYGIEPVTPFLNDKIVQIALETELPLRTDKRILKDQYKGVVPDLILERQKKPWKSKSVIDEGLEHRVKLVKTFIEMHEIHQNA